MRSTAVWKIWDMMSEYQRLQTILKGYSKAAVAFSAGVDSAFLLAAAVDALGAENVLAVTVQAGMFPEQETKEAERFCKDRGIRQVIVRVDETAIEGFQENPRNRCYLCKRELFLRIGSAAKEEGFAVVCEGSNIDDRKDYRPGMQAVEEQGIKSPLRDAGLTKEKIRALSKEMGLSTWDKPSYACLASRFVYGEKITKKKLAMVERAERLLHELGFLQSRVRIHGRLARIEVMREDMEKLMSCDMRDEIVKEFKECGFTHISLDLEGYRTGSMNVFGRE